MWAVIVLNPSGKQSLATCEFVESTTEVCCNGHTGGISDLINHQEQYQT